uniref:Uncharacterized protein n=1 Tax=Peduovirinae sp. ctOza1 TaxID=2825095 RepID=A0A8S5UVZ5_9CAUD|nr:MAG TPA: hypothetical protein [Peduovirinae sp. ctOza1]
MVALSESIWLPSARVCSLKVSIADTLLRNNLII